MPLPVPPPSPKKPVAEQGLPVPTAPKPSSGLPVAKSGPAAPPSRRPSALERLAATDFTNVDLRRVNLAKIGVKAEDLPVFQQAKGRPTAKNYQRELRLVKDDGNARGPIVLDVSTGRLFRQMPKSEYVGEDPVLTVDDFDADDLNKEAANLLSHLQVTSSNEAKAIALEKKRRRQAEIAALQANHGEA